MLRTALPASREARRILVGTLFSAIGRGLTLPFLLIYLTTVRGLNAGTVGLLVGWMGFIALALAPAGGSLMDRFGARRIVLPCFVIEAAGTGSLAFVHGVGQAFAALTLAAVGGAALWSGQTTILAALVTPEERQRAFGLSFTLLNLGIGIGGIIAGFVVNRAHPASFQAIYLADAASYIVPGLILLSMPAVGLRVVGAATEEMASTEEKASKDTGRGGYALVFRNRAFVRFFVFGLTLTTCGYAQIEVGFTAFSTQVVEVSPRVIGWALAGNTLLIVGAQLFVLRWLEGRSRSRALALVGVIFATSWLVLGAAGVAGQSSLPALAIAGVVSCAVIFAMGETLLSPIMPAITNALATDDLRGRYNAVGSMIWGVSGIIGPIAAGPLIGAGRAALWVVLVVTGCLGASVLAWGLHRQLTPAQDGRDLGGSETKTGTEAEVAAPRARATAAREAEPVDVGA
jgi:MFS family permease